MDVAEFEQHILELAFETDVRITTASVAYYLGIPSEKAQSMLDELLERGVLELESDREGNLYYCVADAAGQQFDEVRQLRQDRLQGLEAAVGSKSETPPDREADDPASSLQGAYTTSIDDDGDETPALEPKRSETASPDRSERPPHTSSSSEGSRPHHDDRTSSRYPHPERADSATNGGGRSDVLAGVTRRPAATDAKPDTCGSGSPVVNAEASCDPQPIADSKPVFTSCVDEESTSSPSSTGMMQPAQQAASMPETASSSPGGARQAAGAGGTAAASRQMRPYTQGHLEKPEHQPGMSLLLSFLLCGTGQIYNGEVSKGIMMMVLCFLLWFVLLGWVVHIWSIVDSVVVAERINRRSSNTN